MIMSRTLILALSIALAAAVAGCSDMRNARPGIMQTAPGDPVGSANIGTGSVTTGSTVPPEAKAAGIGLSP
jgi:hypothetical protein